MGNSNERVEVPDETLDYLVENSHFKKNEIKQIYRKFMKESPDGALTKSQFVNLYKTRGATETVSIIAGHMFRAFDLNNSYTVDFNEFVICLSITTRGTLKEQIKWIFRLYDINQDGYLNINEILEILKSANLADEYSETVTELFERMDTNKDGVLTLEEFVNQSMEDFTFVKVLGRKEYDKRGNLRQSPVNGRKASGSDSLSDLRRGSSPGSVRRGSTRPDLSPGQRRASNRPDASPRSPRRGSNRGGSRQDLYPREERYGSSRNDLCPGEPQKFNKADLGDPRRFRTDTF